MTRVALFVGGRAFDAWTTVQIDSDLLTPADAFQFELRRSESSASAWAALVRGVRAGARCRVEVEGVVQMLGVIDEVLVDAAAEGTAVHVSGRDYAGALVDWDAPPHLSWTNVTLASMVRELVAPFGITEVRATNSANRNVLTGAVRGMTPEPLPADFTRISVKQARAEAETTVWELIDLQARRFGLIPWMAVDGSLVLSRPDYLQPPRFRLVRRFDGVGNNVLPGAQYRVSVAGLPTQVLVKFNSGGRAAERVRGGITERHAYRYPDGSDPLAGLHHPKNIGADDVKNRAQAVRRAHREFAKAGADWRTYSARVAGVSQGGALWAPDTTVHVEDEAAGLRETWLCHGRSFTVSREGTFTDLRLSPIGAITP